MHNYFQRLSCIFVVGGILLSAGCGGDGGKTKSKKADPELSKALGSKDKTQPAPTKKSDPAPKKSTSAAAKSSGSGAEWGTLKGRFVFDGSPPVAQKLTVDKDRDFCGKHNIVNESIVVNKDNKGLANVAIYLYVKRGKKPPQAHPSYAEQASTPIIFDNKDCRFAPHVVAVTTSQKLLIGNKDPVGHNTKIETMENAAQNQNLPAGGTFEHQFTKSESRPVPVSCSIHPWMKGFIVIRDNPYVAVTNENGEFEIKNLPAGKLTFQVWHEAGTLSQANVNGKSESWSRGRFDLDIQGDVDLGDIKIGSSVFK